MKIFSKYNIWRLCTIVKDTFNDMWVDDYDEAPTPFVVLLFVWILFSIFLYTLNFWVFIFTNGTFIIFFLTIFIMELNINIRNTKDWE